MQHILHVMGSFLAQNYSIDTLLFQSVSYWDPTGILLIPLDHTREAAVAFCMAINSTMGTIVFPRAAAALILY